MRRIITSGNLLLTVWPRKAFESKATAEQLKNGLSYREVEESDLVGAVKFPKLWSDYRKQKIKAGVYTLRLGFQPEDGDHAGVSPSKDFGVLVAAEKDAGPATIRLIHFFSSSPISTRCAGWLVVSLK